jgi:hypothetical protein
LKFTLAAKVRRVTLMASEENDVQRALKHARTFFSMTFSFGCRLTKPVWVNETIWLCATKENYLRCLDWGSGAIAFLTKPLDTKNATVLVIAL